ncbi:MAG: hypothetical protein ACYDEX_02230 [Mobilitalea sp.]
MNYEERKSFEKRYEYVIGNGLKVDFNINYRMIIYHLPESDELLYPVEIFYTRYEKGLAVSDVQETIESADDYLRTLKYCKDHFYKINAIGSINIKNLLDNIRQLNAYVTELFEKIDTLQDAGEELVRKYVPDFDLEYLKDLDPIYSLEHEMYYVLCNIKNLIPFNTCAIYPNR